VTDPDLPISHLPPHIEESIRSLASLHGDHHQNATSIERAVDRVTAWLAHPSFIVGLTLLIGGWVGANLVADALGYRPVDPPPFVWLGGALSIGSLYMILLILVTQRREDDLAQRREQLTLELAALSEQKITKVIQLLEESRRDNPLIHDRVDQQADEMAQPSDPHSVLHAIKKTHAEAERAGGGGGSSAAVERTPATVEPNHDERRE
jgi:uncharacterized membrane protein